MTEEELAALDLFMRSQYNTLAPTANLLGQGSDYLSMEDTPTSWDRAGDANDLYSDMFKMTQTYLPDWVGGLHQEVQDPGQFTGYRSDVADLYRGNPAYSKLEEVMAEGTPFEEAVRLVAADPKLATYLPQNDFEQVDPGQFRQSAETYVSERAREGREFDQYDSELQAFEDYVRTRDLNDFNPQPSEELVAQRMRPETGAEVLGFDLSRPFGAPVPEEPEAAPAANLDWTAQRQAQGQGPSMRGQGSAGRRRESAPEAAPAPQTGRSAGRRINQSWDMGKANKVAERNRSANDVYRQALEAAGRRKAETRLPSKKEENLSRIAAAYNTLIYGQ